MKDDRDSAAETRWNEEKEEEEEEEESLGLYCIRRPYTYVI